MTDKQKEAEEKQVQEMAAPENQNQNQNPQNVAASVEALAPPSSEKKDVEISRGVRPNANIDREKLKTLFVYDEYNNKIRFVDVFKKQRTIIVFTRHFLDFITKEYVEDLAVIPLEYLQEVDVRLVIIGPAPVKFIKPFKKLTGFQYTMYCDPEREVYKAMGLHEKMEWGNLEDSKHVKSGVIMGVLSTMWRAMRWQEYQGHPQQQGGAFIMGPGEDIHFEHVDETCAGHMNINDLLIKAGVQPVSFPKDQRVVTI